MPYFSFETKANKRYAQSIARKAEELAKNIVPTPFPMDFEYVEKEVFEQLSTINAEIKLKDKRIKRSFSIITNLYSSFLPQWNWPAALIVGYIIEHIEYNSNIIKISEEDFKQYSGMEKNSFYDGLNKLLRPDSPYVCAGDSIKVLARTTKKSIYVVNHNFIFKGKIERFVEMYKEKFPNPCELDSRGKVIIKN